MPRIGLDQRHGARNPRGRWKPEAHLIGPSAVRESERRFYSQKRRSSRSRYGVSFGGVETERGGTKGKGQPRPGNQGSRLGSVWCCTKSDASAWKLAERSWRGASAGPHQGGGEGGDDLNRSPVIEHPLLDKIWMGDDAVLLLLFAGNWGSFRFRGRPVPDRSRIVHTTTVTSRLLLLRSSLARSALLLRSARQCEAEMAQGCRRQ